ncbi:hypothetical protein ABZ819_34360 [Streptomyces venezuelae]|uniref:hypothetical protein n=1 Tax=Streptomyces venezuelae TaxID=54571 RepID=UPI003439459D
MRKRLATVAVSGGIALALAAPAALAAAADEPLATSADGHAVDPSELSTEQIAALTGEPQATGGEVSATEAGLIDPSGTQPMTRAKTRYRKAEFKRGGRLMWTRDTVYFGFNGGKVTSSKGWQANGNIFPNIAKNKGITRYHATGATHKWLAKNTIGAGIPTPWGSVKAYSKDYMHYFTGSKSGAWKWKG